MLRLLPEVKQRTPGARNAGPRRFAAFLAALCLIALTPAETAGASAAQSGTRAGTTPGETLWVLDNAIHLLGDPSADYRKVLLDALAAFPGHADGKTVDEVRRFLARAPEPGDDFRCSAEFVRARARRALLRLRDALLDEYVGPVEPAVCYTVPFAVEMSQAQKAGGWLDIYGYDFDQVTPEMVLVSDEGYRDVTAALVARSHYHLSFKLGDDGVPWSPASVSLGLTWGHLIHHSIAIVQPTSRLCSVRVETIPAGRTVSYSPPRTSGGAFPAQPGATAWADATLDYSSNKLEATFCMAAADSTGSGTRVSGCTVEFLYTTDPDRVIEGVIGELTSQVSLVRADRSSQVRNGRQQDRHGPVMEWAFDVPRGTREPGEVSVTARLGEIRLVSAEDQSCVSPMDYLEARRTMALDSATRRSLDAQLERLDPAAMKLRRRSAFPMP